MADMTEELFTAVADSVVKLKLEMNKLQSEGGQAILGLQGTIIKVVEALSNVCDAMKTMQSEAGTMRRELDQLHAEVAEMKRKQRFQELAVQEAKVVFSDAGDMRRKLSQFE
jgi:hypothetical protein